MSPNDGPNNRGSARRDWLYAAQHELHDLLAAAESRLRQAEADARGDTDFTAEIGRRGAQREVDWIRANVGLIAETIAQDARGRG